MTINFKHYIDSLNYNNYLWGLLICMGCVGVMDVAGSGGDGGRGEGHQLSSLHTHLYIRIKEGDQYKYTNIRLPLRLYVEFTL